MLAAASQLPSPPDFRSLYLADMGEAEDTNPRPLQPEPTEDLPVDKALQDADAVPALPNRASESEWQMLAAERKDNFPVPEAA